MPKLQGYVHGFPMKFLRISVQVVNAAVRLSELQKSAQAQETIRKKMKLCV